MDDAGVNNITAGTGFTLRQSLNNQDLVSEDPLPSMDDFKSALFEKWVTLHA